MTEIQPVSIPMDGKFVSDAAWHAWHIAIDSFRQGFKSRFGNGGLIKHLQGKLGEFAFYYFCQDAMIPVKHTPFRRDYSTLDEHDDFIIELMGRDFVVEVKTQTISNPLKPEDIHLFYNEDQYRAKDEHDYIVVFAGINRTCTQIALIGWIHASDIGKHKVWRRNLKAPAFAIPVSALKPMKKLVEASMQ